MFIIYCNECKREVTFPDDVTQCTCGSEDYKVIRRDVFIDVPLCNIEIIAKPLEM